MGALNFLVIFGKYGPLHALFTLGELVVVVTSVITSLDFQFLVLLCAFLLC